MTSKQTEALELALEALKHCKDVIIERGLNGNPEFAKKWGLTSSLTRAEQASLAIYKALEQPAQQEPVAWLDPWTKNNVTTDYDAYGKRGIPLYTSPPASNQCKFPLCQNEDYQQALAEQIKQELYTGEPAQRKPKTEEFIKHAWANSAPNIGFGDFLVLFRAIEASHDIK